MIYDIYKPLFHTILRKSKGMFSVKIIVVNKVPWKGYIMMQKRKNQDKVEFRKYKIYGLYLDWQIFCNTENTEKSQKLSTKRKTQKIVENRVFAI